MYFVYILTKLESRIWSWLALIQRSQTIASGTESCWQTRLFGYHSVCTCLCSRTHVLSCPTNPTPSCCLSPAQLTHSCSGSSPATYLSLQPHNLDADGWCWWHVRSWGEDVRVGIQTGKVRMRLMQTPAKLGACGVEVRGGWKVTGKVRAGQSLNVCNHCFSLLCQCPEGIEVIEARVNWSGKKHLVLGQEKGRKLRGWRRLCIQAQGWTPLCVPQLSAACLLQRKAWVKVGTDAHQKAYGLLATHVLFTSQHTTLCK